MLAGIRAGMARQADRRRGAPPPAKPIPVIPARATAPGIDVVDLFHRQVLEAKATLEVVASRSDVPAAVARYLTARNAPAQIRLAPDRRIADLPWANAPLLETATGRSHGMDATSVTPAVAAVAETGTLVLQSSAETPTTLHFLPDHHVVVIGRDQIVGTYEQALARIVRDADGGLPRTINFVTGPSRSGDIGKVLLMGAHGPKHLHVILVDEAL
ncbi:L-lactate dehydrogenase complex protein LldG [Dongia mobilis]|uniref:L-lactate dehydrogenase complex protein LldG n=1 Tax=Dongia mobilis TaxID=578943 RepID=A0A4R6WXD9_9PROT|nr:lactate utilization protein [Dongia mobilis]TDQ82255.1 L-lactate dehydrogenase complex protein LldG [Dongia mobilis]